MNRYDTTRILAKDHIVSNDTRATHLNNNDLIIGPSGVGKTRGYVKPNLLQCGHSVIITDTKGSLLGEIGPVMKAQGFKILQLDFTDLFHSNCGYNPLRYIRRNPRTGGYSKQDLLKVCAAIHPVECQKDPFWDRSAQSMLAALIAYTLEALPEEEQELITVGELYDMVGTKPLDELFAALAEENPNSYAVRAWHRVSDNREAKTTFACIRMMVAESLSKLTIDGMAYLYRHEKQVDFASLGRHKTALFLTVSDTDRSLDKLAGLFYTQALQALCDSADKDYPDHRLPVPVRLILDDFATNLYIEDFDNITSVIRSREIYVSIILQSLTQLYSRYGEARGKTIANNCDTWLYLGGQDVDTATCISVKAHKGRETILDMPREDAWLFVQGHKPCQVHKYELTEHPLFPQTPEGRQLAEGAPCPPFVPEESEEPDLSPEEMEDFSELYEEVFPF